MSENLYATIRAQSERVVEIQSRLVEIPALSPIYDGKGELEKARYIESVLTENGIPFIRSDSPDKAAQDGIRPNIIARYPGKTQNYLWIFAHMDVVPPGDENSWTGSPWLLRRQDDLIAGRGVEDNQQAIASMLVLAESLRRHNVTPELGLGMVFLADEECGSLHGMKWLLENNAGLFKPEDYYIVPDGGSPDGSEIEIAEKGQLWLKLSVKGQQAHASLPQLGRNSLVGASQMVIASQSLYRFFPQRNALFNPPFSTFVPTRHEENVPAINILPGKDVFYLDCRLVPEVSPEEVIERVRAIAAEIAAALKLEVDVEIMQLQKATAVSPNSPVVRILEDAIVKVYGVAPRPVGIGGATVAAFLRERGLAAVVWSCLLGACHQPDEKSSITATLKDAMVFAHMLMDTGADAHGRG